MASTEFPASSVSDCRLSAVSQTAGQRTYDLTLPTDARYRLAMQQCLVVLGCIFILGCNGLAVTKSNQAPKDLGVPARSICPSHPESCVGQCCGSACIDTTTDAKNCGGCGKACPDGEPCSGGSCGCPPTGGACGSGQTCCGKSGCVNLNNDIKNCGNCGKSCSAGEDCWNGRCLCAGAECGVGESCCNGVCAGSCNSADMSQPGYTDDMQTLPACLCTMPSLTCQLQNFAGKLFGMPAICVGSNCCDVDVQSGTCPFDPTCTPTPLP